MPNGKPSWRRPVIFIIATAFILGAALGLALKKDAGKPAEISAPRAFEVAANRGWQGTGIRVRAGRPFRLTYLSGQINDLDFRIPDGNGVDYICGTPDCCEPLPLARRSALVGRVGNETFLVGNGTNFNPQCEGALFLRINDCDEGLYDNHDFLKVQFDP